MITPWYPELIYMVSQDPPPPRPEKLNMFILIDYFYILHNVETIALVYNLMLNVCDTVKLMYKIFMSSVDLCILIYGDRGYICGCG